MPSSAALPCSRVLFESHFVFYTKHCIAYSNFPRLVDSYQVKLYRGFFTDNIEPLYPFVKTVSILAKTIMTASHDAFNGTLYSCEPEVPIRDKLQQMNIFLKKYAPGQYYHNICPKCEGGQTREGSLGVVISKDGNSAKWYCFRGTCGYRGATVEAASFEAVGSPGFPQNNKEMAREVVTFSAETVLSEEKLGLQPLSVQQKEYLFLRGITETTLIRNGVKQAVKGKENVIAFPYWEKGKLISCKYRAADHTFWQEKNTRKILYGLDDIETADEIIIVEGELDKLTMEEAGLLHCVGVPDIAPSKVSPKGVPPQTEDKSFEYIWNCEDYFAKARRIILATDSDQSGQALAEELARRLGRERCWRVKWPTWNGIKCKDANEVLVAHGIEALKEMIKNAELYPIRGLFRFCDFHKEIDDYYLLRLGDELGVSTGWSSLDSLYRVVPGELTLVTGIPNSGKSEWIDALLCNLNRIKGWSFALCSMENQVREHGRKLLEKKLGKPFFDAPYAKSVPRMSPSELEDGKQWLNRTFYLIRSNKDELPSIDWVLQIAKSAVMRYGIRGLVIDPYNELDHRRPPSMTETEYVSQILTKMKRFAQHHDCHVWFVAHPKQLQGFRGDPPSLYDISGSAHFINKCDVGIIVHRNRDVDKGPIDQVQILVRKVRNKTAGMIGDAFLSYNRVTGVYTDYLDIGHI